MNYFYHKVADDSEILLESFKNSDLNSSRQGTLWARKTKKVPKPLGEKG
jgi:hypothetical protein